MAGVSVQRKAIELIEAGDWQKAHGLIQNQSDPLSCLIHAYLHREEGDLANARYWYRRAGECLPANTLAEELVRLKGMS